MRLAGQIKLGYYPTPPAVTDLIRTWLALPEAAFAALDPCAGEGVALAEAIAGSGGSGYGVELEPQRASAARARLAHVLTGDYKSIRASIAAFSLLWCNPPYDDEAASEGERGERKEHRFLADTIHYLQTGGVLVYIIPQVRLGPEIARLLSYRFERLAAFRFPDADYGGFEQCVVLGCKRRHGAQDPEAAAALAAFARQGWAAPPFAARTAAQAPYAVPAGGPVRLFRGGVIDPEALASDLAGSAVWARAQALCGAGRARSAGRPPVLLHRGHLALLLAAGEVDGPVGCGDARHVVRGCVRKQVEVSEEEDEHGNVTRRETERLQVLVRTLHADGTTRTLQ